MITYFIFGTDCVYNMTNVGRGQYGMEGRTFKYWVQEWSCFFWNVHNGKILAKKTWFLCISNCFKSPNYQLFYVWILIMKSEAEKIYDVNFLYVANLIDLNVGVIKTRSYNE